MFLRTEKCQIWQILTESFEKLRKDLTLIFYSKQLETLVITPVKYERQIFSQFHKPLCQKISNPKIHKENWDTLIYQIFKFQIFSQSHEKKCEEI